MEKERYEVVFTPLAKAFAEAKASLAAVEDQVRIEIAELECDPMEIMFHVAEVNGQTFMVIPRGGHMVIDLAEFEEVEMTEGPFKGKTVEMPRPASDE